ncbi:MAG: class I SAM-dependent methyltransferase [Anaerolineae bacterium]|jgi:demethylmenaquinone methyltransferase/2-methoxy-6-polyprenyl-1,4-benzoquinol methylase
MSYVYMKVLESAPERYDWGMRLLTLGRLGRVHRDMAARLHREDRVLDIGCGTGALAVLLARKGVHVTGVDISPPMMSLAARRLKDEGLGDQVTLRELGAVDLDTAFPDASFDAVVSSLVFSELSDDEIEYTLAECHRILRPGGQLLIADEVLPDSAWGKAATFFVRLPFAVLAFILTQNTTRRVAGLGERIEGADFRLVDVGCYLAGTLQLFVAEKRG